jgi:hypothetical protein
MHTRRLRGPLLLVIVGALSWACKESDDDDGAGGASGSGGSSASAGKGGRGGSSGSAGRGGSSGKSGASGGDAGNGASDAGEAGASVGGSAGHTDVGAGAAGDAGNAGDNAGDAGQGGNAAGGSGAGAAGRGGAGNGGSGGGCPTDPTEPNETVAQAVELNDAASAVTCSSSPATGTAAFANDEDIDHFRIYVNAAECADPMPTITFTSTPPVAASVCLYANDCTERPAVVECQPGSILTEDTANGRTGCCNPIGGTGFISIIGFEPCSGVNELTLSLTESPICAAFSVEVSL